ncbi:MAG: VOC family protein [Oscillospiraceae bacterium]|nr:VOC family protein [Oscillospiraceae bacterium]
MKRSMMQVFVKGGFEALELYKKAFNAEVLCSYEDGNGGYMHAELNVYGQAIAVSEITQDAISGNTMMFCFEFGEGGGDLVKKAYEVLKNGAKVENPPQKCDYSPCQCVLNDKFGVTWCLFE